jgi:signal transduction histidine kinase
MIGWSDYICGPEISLSLFYLVPITATAWWFGRIAGIVTAVESAVAAFTADYVWAGPEVLPVEIWNTVTRVIIFFFAAAFVARLSADSEAGRDALRTARRTLTARLIGAQEEERRHLARELHDEIGAVLTCVKMSLESAGRRRTGRSEELRAALDAVDQALAQIRQLSVDLRPSVLDDLGIVPALRWYLDKRPRAAGLKTEFETSIGEERLDPALEITCFRIAQEAVTNVLRHADAGALRVTLDRSDGRLLLRVKDDGRGFDTAAVGSASLGLSAMSERASLIGGAVRVLSWPGGGTEVIAELPVRVQAHLGDAA